MTSNKLAEAIPWHIPRLVITWVIALIMAIAVVLFTPREDRFEWLVIILGLSVIISFAMQLATAQREGFITRLAFSIVGALLVIGIVELCAFLLGSR